MRLLTLSIRSKIYAIVGVALAAGAVLAAVLLVAQARQSTAYEVIIRETTARRHARMAQLSLEREVGQFRELLLRGSDQRALEVHMAGVHRYSVGAENLMDSLRAAHIDAAGQELEERFRVQHAELDARLESIRTLFVAAKGLNASLADSLSRGQEIAASATLDTLVSHLTQLSGVRLAAQQAAVTVERRWSSFGAVAFLLAIGVLTLMLGTLLTRPIEGLLRVARGIAMGDVDQEVAQAADDELGELADAFRESIAYLRGMADAAERTARGDVSVAIVPRSDRDRLSRAFASVTGTLRALTDETRRLDDAVEGGDLTVESNLPAFEGAYRELLVAVNHMMGTSLAPLREATTALERVADRDLTVRLTGNYRGDHARIQTAFNTAVEALAGALHQVGVASAEVAGASEQIASGSQSLAQGSSEQASTIEQVGASLQEIAQVSESTTNNAVVARALTNEAQEVSQRGAVAMNRLSGAVARIDASSAATARIVRTIDEIAFQTNLLALNAAVEAARAGDAGRGFAVVADEVRSLALRSAEAAKSTALLIEENVRNAADGRAIAAEVIDNLSAIGQRVGRVCEVVGEIATSSDQQARGIAQLNVALEQLAGTTGTVAASSEESASAGEELAAQSRRMLELVGQFDVGDGAPARKRAAELRDRDRASAAPVVSRRAPPVATRGSRAAARGSAARRGTPTA